MTSFTNSFEGGTNATSFTAANSGGASGDACTSVSVGTGASLTFSSHAPAHGSMGLLATTGSTSTTAYAEWVLPAATASVGGRIYTYGEANLTGSIRFVGFQSGSTTCCRIGESTAGKIQIINGAGTAIATSTSQRTLNQQWRIEWSGTMDATAGALTVKIFNGDSTTVLETLSVTAQNFSGTADRVRLGVVANAANVVARYYDDFVFNDTGTFPGPGGSTAWTQTVDDPVGITDPVVNDTAKQIADDTGLTDPTSTALAHSVTFDDGTGLSDTTVLPAHIIITKLTVLLDQTISGITAFPATVTGHASIEAYSANTSDTLFPDAVAGPATIPTPSMTVGTTIGDRAGLTDSVSFDVASTKTDPVGLTGATAASTDHPTTDTLGLSDDVTTLLSFAFGIDDLLGVTDTTSFTTAKGWTITDPVGLLDGTAADEVHVVTDDVGLSGQATTSELGIVRSFDDLLASSDGVASDVVLSLAEDSGLLDSWGSLADYVLRLDDALSLSDVATNGANALLTFLDTVTASDNSGVVLNPGVSTVVEYKRFGSLVRTTTRRTNTTVGISSTTGRSARTITVSSTETSSG